jgi:hypothetical protein
MAYNKSNTRRAKIKFLNDIRAGKIELLPIIEDLIVIHENTRLSMRTGKTWYEEPKSPLPGLGPHLLAG